MPIEFSCPSCHQLVRMPDAVAGKKGCCPNCNGIVHIPKESTANVEPKPAPHPTPEPKKKQRFKTESDLKPAPVKPAPTAAGAMDFRCPKCGHGVKTPAIAAGMLGECPKCKSVIQIPKTSQAAPRRAAAAAGATIDLNCPNCSQQIKTPASTAGKKGKCRHCQTIFAIPGVTPDAAGGLEPIDGAGGLEPIDAGGFESLDGGLQPDSGGLQPIDVALAPMDGGLQAMPNDLQTIGGGLEPISDGLAPLDNTMADPLVGGLGDLEAAEMGGGLPGDPFGGGTVGGGALGAPIGGPLGGGALGAPVQPVNPNAAPHAPSSTRKKAKSVGIGRTLSIGETFSKTWSVYMEKLGEGVLVSLVLIGYGILMGILISAFLFVGVWVVPGVMATFGVDIERITASGGAIIVLGNLFAIPILYVNSFLQAGLVKWSVNVARGRKSSVNDMFDGGPYLLRVFGFNLLSMVVMVPVALVFDAIRSMSEHPAILITSMLVHLLITFYVGLLLLLVVYLIVDKEQEVFTAILNSAHLMGGLNHVLVFVVYFVFFFCATFVYGITCGIGMLFVIPYFFVLNGVIYTQIVGKE